MRQLGSERTKVFEWSGGFVTTISVDVVNLNEMSRAEVKRSLVEAFNQTHRVWTSKFMDDSENFPLEQELGKLLDHFQECIDLLDQGEQEGF